MAQPPPYTPVTDFSDFQAGAPSAPFPGQKVDDELAAIKQTLDVVLANLALLQRDDTQPKNKIVTNDTLKQSNVFKGARILAVDPRFNGGGGFMLSRGTVDVARFAASDFLEPATTTTLRLGVGEPVNEQYDDGDHYRDTASLNLYFKRAGVWTVVGELPGPSLTLSGAIHVGPVRPLNSFGNNFDLFVAEETGARWIRIAGGWVWVGKVGTAVDLPDPYNGRYLGWIDGRLSNIAGSGDVDLTDVYTQLTSLTSSVSTRATIDSVTTLGTDLYEAIAGLETTLHAEYSAADTQWVTTLAGRSLAEALITDLTSDDDTEVLTSDDDTRELTAGNPLQEQINARATIAQVSLVEASAAFARATLSSSLTTAFQAGDNAIAANVTILQQVLSTTTTNRALLAFEVDTGTNNASLKLLAETGTVYNGSRINLKADKFLIEGNVIINGGISTAGLAYQKNNGIYASQSYAITTSSVKIAQITLKSRGNIFSFDFRTSIRRTSGIAVASTATQTVTFELFRAGSLIQRRSISLKMLAGDSSGPEMKHWATPLVDYDKLADNVDRQYDIYCYCSTSGADHSVAMADSYLAVDELVPGPIDAYEGLIKSDATGVGALTKVVV